MSPITPEQWKGLRPYLDQALTLSDQELTIWLQSLDGVNPEIAVKLRELLDKHHSAEKRRFLEDGVGVLLGSGYPGEDIGAYKLISTIGHGGMGTVWLAERSDGRFERKAAVKFLNMALVGRGLEERFQREGAILGRLSHANIAELLDAGVTATSQPYLVIEHVEGDPIDHYCDQHKLSVEQRIRLFLDVLAAVAHAHANLVIHRDIKPHNVLVSKNGQVKLLDFGIAKLLESEGNSGPATLLTHEAGAPFTPEYAAPEQITGSPVTTATDVYALGVLLYLILTGLHPAGPSPYSPADLLKTITEDEPNPPSEVVTPYTAHAFTLAANRNTTPDKLGRQLRGELDTIVAKALKKNPQGRYTSVSAFAEDLQRYLNEEPIHARRDTFTYRAVKFVRRHRMAVSLITVAALAIVAGLVGTLVQAHTARLQRDTAIRERDRANRITEFMANMFKVSDPYQPTANVTAREILDRSALQIEAGLAKDPEAQAHMMHVMGDVYNKLGLFSQSENLLRRAVALQQKVLGQENPQTLTSLSELAAVLAIEGSYPEAERLQRQALEAQTRVLGTEHADTAASMARLATVLGIQGRRAEAEKLKREAVAIDQRVLGPEHPDTLMMTNSLVTTLWSEGDERLYPEAENLQRQALAIERRVLGPEHPDTLNAMISLGVITRRSGQFAEAEKIYRETLAIQNRVLGPNHPDTLVLRDNLATAVAKQGRYQEAEELYMETRSAMRRVYGPDHPNTANGTYNLACLAAVQDHKEQALNYLNEALAHGLRTNTALAMDRDEDLKSLYGEPRFIALVAHVKKKAVADKSN